MREERDDAGEEDGNWSLRGGGRPVVDSMSVGIAGWRQWGARSPMRSDWTSWPCWGAPFEKKSTSAKMVAAVRSTVCESVVSETPGEGEDKPTFHKNGRATLAKLRSTRAMDRSSSQVESSQADSIIRFLSSGGTVASARKAELRVSVSRVASGSMSTGRRRVSEARKAGTDSAHGFGEESGGCWGGREQARREPNCRDGPRDAALPPKAPPSRPDEDGCCRD